MNGMDEMKGTKLSKVGFVKTVLMLLIILGHACDNWVGNWFTEAPAIESKGLSIFATWLNSFHIFAFTLISGYLFAFKIDAGSTETTLNSFKIRLSDCLFHMSSLC